MTYINYPATSVQPYQLVQPNQLVIPNLTMLNILPQQPVVAAKTTTLGEAFKPVKAGTKKSHIIFILDDSGSMQSCREQTIKGFNEYLDGQKLDAETTKIETFVSLYKFDGWNVNCAIDHIRVQEVTPLNKQTYNPQGGTNLLDALGGVMLSINEKLVAIKKANRESVIITLLTDGEENQSKTFNNADVKAMVEKAEAKNWGFMFLGANVDAFSTGATMGFNVSNTVQFTNASSTNAILSASAMTTRMRTAYANSESTLNAYTTAGFTEQERNSSVTADDK